MLVGDLVATLRADGTAQFTADVNKAGRELQKLGTLGQQAGKLVKAGIGVASGVVTSATGLIATMGTTAIAAGVGFNRLQQNSGVALKTLLGSSEAAQAQLAKLNEFTSKSPFGRDTFMKAQQTLLGFGVEAEKVIPYLDGIQNAVAGIGGSDADILHITQTIAKIRSSATLGQQDLLELGNAGINAAALIAQATGKSEAEVRASIFGNPLRGEEALAGLDAMMRGMNTKFKGTTDQLKQQFDGARDRVKASMRDIGAVLSAPIIDPKGGGWGVVLTNSYADILRGVQKALTPIMGDVSNRIAKPMLNLNSALQRIASTVRQIDMSDIRSGLAKLEPYLPVVAGGFAALTAKGLGSIPVLGQLGLSFNPIVAGLMAAASASPELRAGLSAIMNAARPLLPVVLEVGRSLTGVLSSGLGIVGDVLTAVAPLVESFARVIASIPTPLLTAGVALAGVVAAMRQFSIVSTVTAGLTKLKGAFDTARLGAMEIGSAFRNARDNGANLLQSSVSGLSSGLSGVKGAASRVGGALLGAFGGPVGLAITGVVTAVGLFSAAAADAKQKSAEWKAGVEQLNGTLDKTTGAITEATLAQIGQNLAADGWDERSKELINGTGSLADMTLAAAGKNQQMIDTLVHLASAQVDWNRKIHQSGGGMITYKDALSKAGVSQQEFILALAEGGARLDAVKKKLMDVGVSDSNIFTNAKRDMQGINFEALEKITSLSSQLGAAGEAFKQYADAAKEGAAASSEAALKQQQLQEALAVASDSMADQSERLRALKTALDLLNGGTMTAAEQQAALDEATRDMADAFAQANEAAGGLSNVLNADGTFNTASEAGAQFRDELLRISESAQNAAISAANLAEQTGGDVYAASVEAMKPYIAEMEKLQEQYGLTDQQMQGMYEQIGLMPEQVGLVLAFDGLEGANKELAGVAFQLQNLEAGQTTVNVDVLSDEAKTRLEQLGYKVKELADGTYEVSVDADPSKAQKQIEDLTNGLLDKNTKIPVDADTQQAIDKMNEITDNRRQTVTMPIDADTAPGQVKFNAFTEQVTGTTSTSKLDADSGLAFASLMSWFSAGQGTTSRAQLDAANNMAFSSLWSWSTSSSRTIARASLDANANPAYGAVSGWRGSANNTTATAHLYADDSHARSVLDKFPKSFSVLANVVGMKLRADGGIEEYANGGIRRHVPTGIYPGGANIIKFAEPETRWEAFISGKAGQEERNRRILEQVAPRLGMRAVRAFADGGVVEHRVAGTSNAVQIDGATLVLEVGGERIEGVLRQIAAPVAASAADRAIHSYDRAGSRYAAHGRQKGR